MESVQVKEGTLGGLHVLPSEVRSGHWAVMAIHQLYAEDALDQGIILQLSWFKTIIIWMNGSVARETHHQDALASFMRSFAGDFREEHVKTSLKRRDSM